MEAVEFGLETAELDQESIELLPARQTLSYHHCGYYGGLHLGLSLNLGLVGYGCCGW